MISGASVSFSAVDDSFSASKVSGTLGMDDVVLLEIGEELITGSNEGVEKVEGLVGEATIGLGVSLFGTIEMFDRAVLGKAEDVELFFLA